MDVTVLPASILLMTLPKKVCQTITFDQGGEFANFQLLEDQLRVYYCHVRLTWEKGSNENVNGRIRRFLPANTHIVLLSTN